MVRRMLVLVAAAGLLSASSSGTALAAPASPPQLLPPATTTPAAPTAAPPTTAPPSTDPAPTPPATPAGTGERTEEAGGVGWVAVGGVVALLAAGTSIVVRQRSRVERAPVGALVPAEQVPAPHGSLATLLREDDRPSEDHVPSEDDGPSEGEVPAPGPDEVVAARPPEGVAAPEAVVSPEGASASPEPVVVDGAALRVALPPAGPPARRPAAAPARARTGSTAVQRAARGEPFAPDAATGDPGPAVPAAAGGHPNGHQPSRTPERAARPLSKRKGRR